MPPSMYLKLVTDDVHVEQQQQQWQTVLQQPNWLWNKFYVTKTTTGHPNDDIMIISFFTMLIYLWVECMHISILNLCSLYAPGNWATLLMHWMPRMKPIWKLILMQCIRYDDSECVVLIHPWSWQPPFQCRIWYHRMNTWWMVHRIVHLISAPKETNIITAALSMGVHPGDDPFLKSFYTQRSWHSSLQSSSIHPYDLLH